MLAAPYRQELIGRTGFDRAEQMAKQGAICDYGLFMEATAQNAMLSLLLGENCAGLKLYLDDGIDMDACRAHLRLFPANRPIVCHLPENGRQTLVLLLYAARKCERSVHIAHVARAEEFDFISRMRAGEQKGITCGVCPS